METWHLCVQREEELPPHNHHSQQICQVLSGENVWFCLMPTFPDCFPTAGSSTPRGWPSGLTASWTSRTSPWIARDVLLKSGHVSEQTLIKRKTSEHSPLVGYTNNDLLYQWTAGRGVNIASDMKLSQFDLISTPTGNETVRLNHGKKDPIYTFRLFSVFSSGSFPSNLNQP